MWINIGYMENFITIYTTFLFLEWKSNKTMQDIRQKVDPMASLIYISACQLRPIKNKMNNIGCRVDSCVSQLSSWHEYKIYKDDDITTRASRSNKRTCPKSLSIIKQTRTADLFQRQIATTQLKRLHNLFQLCSQNTMYSPQLFHKSNQIKCSRAYICKKYYCIHLINGIQRKAFENV